MESAQMIIGKKQITELSEILHSPRSDVMGMVMWEGVKNLRMKIASEKYVNEEFSLCRGFDTTDGKIPCRKRDLFFQTECKRGRTGCERG